MPPKASHGEDVCRLFSEVCAASAVTGVGLLDPSIRTSPERSRPPGRPLKSQVAYAVVIEPPSEWPPIATLRPPLPAALTTTRRSLISVFIPHWRAKGTDESGTLVTWFVTLGLDR